jgi:hypothetical protein
MIEQFILLDLLSGEYYAGYDSKTGKPYFCKIDEGIDYFESEDLVLRKINSEIQKWGQKIFDNRRFQIIKIYEFH